MNVVLYLIEIPAPGLDNQNIEKLMELVKSTDFQTEEIEVNEVTVMKSQLHPAGAIYTPLKKIALL